MNKEKILKHLKLPSKLQLIEHYAFKEYNLYFKRDDLIHSLISGNKWRKLMFAMDDFFSSHKKEILSFGGAFSNHILATAVLSKILGIPSIGLIRTHEIDPLNPTLMACSKNNMKLFAMNRSMYKQKSTVEILESLQTNYPDAYIIPEGGSSNFAIPGVNTVIEELNHQIEHFDILVSGLGTAGTATGLLTKLNSSTKYIIAPAINQYSDIAFKKDYQALTGREVIDKDYSILYSLDNKAYAKKDLSLFDFIQDFYLETGILLDPIYTGKAMRVLIENIHKIPKESKIVFYHSGGIQAWNGYFYRFKQLKSEIPEIYKFMKTYNSNNNITIKD